MDQTSESKNLYPKLVVPDSILKQCQCSLCGNHLTKAPIRNKNDVYICGRCPEDGIRESLLEAFMQQFLFPCRFRSLGCTSLLEWNSKELERHDIACDFKRLTCLVKSCQWLDSKSKLAEHFTTCHLKNLCDDDTYFTLDLTKEEQVIFVYESFERKYFLGKIQSDGNVIHFSMMYIENVSNFNEYVFDVTFYKDDRQLRYMNRKVVPYCESAVFDSETLDISTCDAYFQNKNIDVQFVVRSSKINVDTRIRCELTLKDIECPICTEPMKGKISTFGCGHSVCSDCCGYYLKNCPICRSIISYRIGGLEIYDNYKLEEILEKIKIK